MYRFGELRRSFWSLLAVPIRLEDFRFHESDGLGVISCRQEGLQLLVQLTEISFSGRRAVRLRVWLFVLRFLFSVDVEPLREKFRGSLCARVFHSRNEVENISTSIALCEA